MTDALFDALETLVGDDDRPIVVYAALWPLARALRRPGPALTEALLDRLAAVAGPDRSLMMPTFTGGFREGLCDLDREPSRTGQLSEAFRARKGVRRTVSAFFPFAVSGPDSDELVALRPRHAWGDNSVVDWMESRNVRFLMLGTHPTHCSYLHRMEWLLHDRIAYRHVKTFTGRVWHEGKEIPLEEQLFVRSLEPNAVNDFTVLKEPLMEAGMRQILVQGASIAAMDAITMRDAVLALMQADPFLVLRNRQDFAA